AFEVLLAARRLADDHQACVRGAAVEAEVLGRGLEAAAVEGGEGSLQLLQVFGLPGSGARGHLRRIGRPGGKAGARIGARLRRRGWPRGRCGAGLDLRRSGFGSLPTVDLLRETEGRTQRRGAVLQPVDGLVRNGGIDAHLPIPVEEGRGEYAYVGFGLHGAARSEEHTSE